MTRRVVGISRDGFRLTRPSLTVKVGPGSDRTKMGSAGVNSISFASEQTRPLCLLVYFCPFILFAFLSLHHPHHHPHTLSLLPLIHPASTSFYPSALLHGAPPSFLPPSHPNSSSSLSSANPPSLVSQFTIPFRVPVPVPIPVLHPIICHLVTGILTLHHADFDTFSPSLLHWEISPDCSNVSVPESTFLGSHSSLTYCRASHLPIAQLGSVANLSVPNSSTDSE